ncbi:DinB family protein [Kutzneria viridogrisea]|uniref:Damage-inducible protein DinB n=1 Tax=Kutzneria viridogrisea TaxID=47990 RepID=A0ABR6BNH8_9PSEU|nr:putative damage-inducible protein DinB [Kutzneria viridogrisea]
MNSARDDIVETSDYVWQRLSSRLAGLTEAEFHWQPEVTTLKWRLRHIVDFLSMERNWTWLGLEPSGVTIAEPTTAAGALSALDQAYAAWSSVLAASTDSSLQEPIGPLGGPYATATRRAFVLHILDELVHHGAEAALMRDLYAARQRG